MTSRSIAKLTIKVVYFMPITCPTIPTMSQAIQFSVGRESFHLLCPRSHLTSIMSRVSAYLDPVHIMYQKLQWIGFDVQRLMRTTSIS